MDEPANELTPSSGAAVAEPCVPLPPLISERPGKRVGRYKLQDRIGEGGCGVVFLAEQQEPVRRAVALKVIKPGMDTQSVVARFEAERQALAILDHPNIAKVLDGGATDSGRPYFVMELVRGPRITDYCDENHLSTGERLALFTQVCHAIQHAHQKGIIHRDIKPSNVLVTVQDGAATPKVIDFGIAKATGERLTDKTLLTELHQVIGTPTYMSPEQADVGAVDIDTRSDIYSLGVLLYELLTGRPPFDAQALLRAGVDEMRRVIREQDPPKPSTRLSRLSDADLTAAASHRQAEPAKLPATMRGDLDSIAMKCLEKDRARRYETADALALDVQSYLAHEPVLATPPSAGYRVRKFVRRNRGPVIAASIIAGMLLAAFAGLITGIVVIDNERERTLAALDRETAALARETEERELKETALTAETRAKTRTVAALRTMTDKVVEDLLGRQQQFGEHEAQFLRDVERLYEEFTREQGQSPAARALRAEGYARVAVIRRKFGERVQAERDMQRSLTILDELANEFPRAVEYPRAMADAHYRYGILLSELGKPVEAQAALRRASALNEQLIKQHGNAPDRRHMLAVIHTALGGTLRDAGKFKDAQAELQRSIELHTKLTTEFPANTRYQETFGHTLNILGFGLHVSGQHAEAADVHRRVIDIQKNLVARFPGVPEYRHELASAHDKLGAALRDLGTYAEAKTHYDRAITIYEEVAAKFPAVPGYRVSLAGGYVNLAHVMLKEGDATGSVDPYSKAIAILQGVMPQARNHASTRRYLHNALEGRAQAFEQLDRYAEAAKDSGRAASFAAASDVADTRLRQVIALARAGDGKEAIDVAERVAATDQTTYGLLWEASRALHRLARSVPTDVGQSFRHQSGRLAHASIPSAEKRFAKDPSALEHAYFKVAEQFADQASYADAERYCRDMLKSRRSRLPDNHNDVLSATEMLSRVLAEWAYSERTIASSDKPAQRADEAVRLLRRCRGIRASQPETSDWRLADTESRLGFALVAVAATDHTLATEKRIATLVQAEPLLLSGCGALLQIDDVESRYHQRAHRRIVQLYEFWGELSPGAGNAQKAAAWRKRLAELDGSAVDNARPPEPDDQ